MNGMAADPSAWSLHGDGWAVALGFSGLWHGEPWGWVKLVGPAVVLWFLLKITGVPPTGERALARRGHAYRAYQRRTDRFFPGPPKTEATP